MKKFFAVFLCLFFFTSSYAFAMDEEEAYDAWNKAVRGESFDKIQPLI